VTNRTINESNADNEKFSLIYFLSKTIIVLIRIYQIFISPWLPNTCRFYPTCSQYAIDAVGKYGPLGGSFRAVWRVLRCNPWNPGGYDPVS
jgi:putative membrane protein insertion efficiency factor